MLHCFFAVALMRQVSSNASVSDIFTALAGTGTSVFSKCNAFVSKPRINVDQAIQALEASPTAFVSANGH